MHNRSLMSLHKICSEEADLSASHCDRIPDLYLPVLDESGPLNTACSHLLTLTPYCQLKTEKDLPNMFLPYTR